MSTVDMEVIGGILLIAGIAGSIAFYLLKRQIAFAKTIKVGDIVKFEDNDAEVLEVINDNCFVIKVKVSGIQLYKK